MARSSALWPFGLAAAVGGSLLTACGAAGEGSAPGQAGSDAVAPAQSGGGAALASSTAPASVLQPCSGKHAGAACFATVAGHGYSGLCVAIPVESFGGALACIPLPTFCTTTCGASGQTCCAPGNTCTSALTCQNGTCLTPPAQCGASGQGCCAPGNTCNSGLTCQGGTCATPPAQCGAAGQACCTSGNGCVSGNACCDGASCCEGTACCNGTSTAATGTCQVKHSNGTGQSYFDCYPLGTPGNPSTYNSTMASDAANASTQAGTALSALQCGTSGNTTTAVCKSADPAGLTGTCTCWAYAGNGTGASNVGHVYASSGVGSDQGCFCPSSTDRTWN